MLTVNINVKKTWDKHRVYSLGKTSENILENKLFTGVFPAQQNYRPMSCLPCVNREYKCKENVRQTSRLLSWENTWKHFGKTKCSQEFFQRSKIDSEYHVFLVFTVNINVKKTWDKHRIYPLGKTSENILENKVFTGVFPAQQNYRRMPCFPCVNREYKCKKNVRQTPRLLSWENIWKHFGKRSVHGSFFSAAKLPANVMSSLC